MRKWPGDTRPLRKWVDTPRMVALLMAVALLLSMSFVQATAAEPHTVFISVSDSSVKVGEKVHISGSVLPQHARPLRLEIKYSDAWRKIARTMTTDSGRYSFSHKPSSARDRYYRVCKIGGSAVCSKAKLVRVKPKHPATQPTISIGAVASYELTTEDSYDISGTTSPDLVGKNLYLQLLNNADSTWSSISEPVAVESGGSFHFFVPARQAGRDLKLRVYAPATSTTKTAHQDTEPFTVYGWVYVDTLDWVEGAWNEGTATVNGTSYPRSVYAYHWDADSGAVDLGRKCKTLTATVGLRDDSSSTVQMSTAVTADSTEINRIDGIGLGQSTPISLDITGILRLTFSVTRTSGSGYWYLVYGDARALCAF